MFDCFKKQWVIMVQLDSTKDARLVSSKEGYGNVVVNNYTEDLYRNSKVRLTIPTQRTYWGAVKRSKEYSKMGILNCIIKA